MFGFHPTQVGGWKKQALAGLPNVWLVFSTRRRLYPRPSARQGIEIIELIPVADAAVDWQ
jgi:hypothetical protein